ncbi:MAG: hypothetical protein RJA24_1180 [Pseudomonadota bacterium]|jgi:hypothetical protein
MSQAGYVDKLLRFAMTLTLSVMAAGAAAQVPFEIEGPINNVDPDRRTITVMGQTISVPLRTPLIPIMSPTARVTLQQLDGARLPGRIERGFIGGTAIISGQILADGSYVADDVFAEPAENVLRGTLTGVNPFRIGVVELRALTDPRMPSGPLTNQFGFEIDGASLQPGVFAASGGYFSGSDNVLYYHTLDIEGNTRLRNPGNQVSIQRAQCRIRGGGRDEIEVRGGVTNGSPNTTPVRLAAGTQVSLTLLQRGGRSRTLTVPAVISLDINSPGYGSYLFRASNLNFPVQGCPQTVTVSSQLNGAVLANSPEFEVSAR